MNRRGLLGGILAAGFAPAFVGSGVLMPVKKIIVPSLDDRFLFLKFGTNDLRPGAPNLGRAHYEAQLQQLVAHIQSQASKAGIFIRTHADEVRFLPAKGGRAWT